MSTQLKTITRCLTAAGYLPHDCDNDDDNNDSSTATIRFLTTQRNRLIEKI